MDDKEFEDTLFDLVGRHFVALRWFDQTPDIRDHLNRGSGDILHASGFIVSIKEHWFFVTAGHIIESIDIARSRGQVLTRWELDDAMTSNAVSRLAIPFDYERSPKYFYNMDGADYALIYIRPFYRSLLSANGIIPISDNEWSTNIPRDFFKYFLVGIPSESMHITRTGEIAYHLAILELNPEITPPAHLVKSTSRFYASLPKTPRDAAHTVSDIDGMSGGPIFGFALVGSDLRYWLHSIQSSWSPSDRIVATCPFEDFGNWVSDHFLPSLNLDARAH